MAGGRTWDNEETRLLEKLVRANTPNKDIAATLGRSVVAIRNRKHQLGLLRTLMLVCPTCERTFHTSKDAPRTCCTNRCARQQKAAERVASRPSIYCACGNVLPDQAVLYCSQACNSRAWYERSLNQPVLHAARLAAHRRYLAGRRADQDLTAS